MDTESKFSQELTLQAIERAVPMSEIEAVLQEENALEKRERKLNMAGVVLLTIGMNLYTYLSLKQVMRKMAKGLRFVWPEEDISLPKDGAISYRRYQLGARPLVGLFWWACLGGYANPWPRRKHKEPTCLGCA